MGTARGWHHNIPCLFIKCWIRSWMKVIRTQIWMKLQIPKNETNLSIFNKEEFGLWKWQKISKSFKEAPYDNIPTILLMICRSFNYLKLV